MTSSIAARFTIAFVGDCVLSRPVSRLAGRDPAFGGVLDLLATADVGCGNLETVIFDPREQSCHPYPWDGDWTLAAEPAAAADLAAMNIRLVSRANNHALDWGTEGMRATSSLLDQARVVHAGAGADEATARAARYLETPAGRVGLASFATTFRPFSDALAPHGEAPGRPGVSPVALTRIAVLPANLFDALAAVTGRLGMPAAGGYCQLFGQRVERAAGGEPAPARYRYQPCEEHLRAELRAIRLGRQHSDYLVATLHSHEAASEAAPTEPAHIVGELARRAIDAGADAFVTTGIHRLGPVEIYRGRPIFHGMGNSFWSDIQQPLPGELYRVHRELLGDSSSSPSPSTQDATDADLSRALNAASFDHDWVFESVLARCRYDEDGLAELLLHPVELGRGRGLTTSGIPRLPDAERGRGIIERLAESSAPFGTSIEWTGTAGRVKL
jgi:poly-gamma-glutamate capsule biosynthesis protein CapA/YwtB (metallophosphatase superfamily)